LGEYHKTENESGRVAAPRCFAGELTGKQALLVTGYSAVHYWKCDEIMWDLRSEVKVKVKVTV
jgi:hypothetical protein